MQEIMARSGATEVHIKHPKIRKNDKVTVITGKEKGKIGAVLKVDSEKGRIIVEKVNVVKRHSKANMQTGQGGIIEKEAPLDISNVMIVCNKCAQPTRIGNRKLDGSTKVRLCKKCGEPMDD
jgi:large subunit ribosomal protein L24